MAAFGDPSPACRRNALIADEMAMIESTLVGAGRTRSAATSSHQPAARTRRRDVTPEATLAIADKVMPGFGEQMRSSA